MKHVYSFNTGLKKIKKVISSVNNMEAYNNVKNWSFSAIKFLCFQFGKDYEFYIDLIITELKLKEKQLQNQIRLEEKFKCQHLNT